MTVQACAALERTALQWGRDHLIAEIVAWGNSRVEAWELQWGRDHLIAEMLDASRDNGSMAASFNGAAII